MLDHADTLIKGWTMCHKKKKKDHTSFFHIDHYLSLYIICCHFEEYPDNDRSLKMFH